MMRASETLSVSGGFVRDSQNNMKFHTVTVTRTQPDHSTVTRFVWDTTWEPEAVVVIEMIHDKAETVKLYRTSDARQIFLGLINAGRVAYGSASFVWDSDKTNINDDMHKALSLLRLNAPGS